MVRLAEGRELIGGVRLIGGLVGSQAAFRHPLSPSQITIAI
jgi:hypothetical protein